jgi:hypothetical protein
VTPGFVNSCFVSHSSATQLDKRSRSTVYRLRSWCRPIWPFALLLATRNCALGQTAASSVSVTLGMSAPVVGKIFTAYALVTNPAFVPAPTGSVQFDFGDGSPSVMVPMSYRVATTTHTYTSAGPANVTATYSGDSNFQPTSARLQGQVVRSVPNVTLNVYGDSISYASNAVLPAGNWVSIAAYAEGWSLNDMALPGYKVADEAPFAYATKVAPDTYSAVLLGQNDFNGTDPRYVTQYQNSLLAVSTWLLIPDADASGAHPKVLAQDQSVTKNGAWTTSSLYPTMGLNTAETGDSLTSTVTGSTIYVGSSGTTTSDYTLDVYVDGSLAAEYIPLIVYAGNVTQTVPWMIRIPLTGASLTDSHNVTAVCKTPGSSGCNVDWFAGNGFVVPKNQPLLWLGEPYITNQTGTTYQNRLPYDLAIRQIGQALQLDGLGITLADVFDNFDGQFESQCLVDTIHPNECGFEIIAATYIGAMDWLFTKDQRIDFGSQNSANFSTASIPVNVGSTSGLPIKLNVLSGPATLANGELYLARLAA